jgi:hypothetical protein
MIDLTNYIELTKCWIFDYFCLIQILVKPHGFEQLQKKENGFEGVFIVFILLYCWLFVAT